MTITQQHDSDCSTNNRGVPELLGPCDCSIKPTPAESALIAAAREVLAEQRIAGGVLPIPGTSMIVAVGELEQLRGLVQMAPGPFYDHKGVAHDTMPIDEGTGLPLYRPAPAVQASPEASSLEDGGSVDTPEFMGRVIAAASEAMSVGQGGEWESFVAHIHAWAASRAAATPATTAQPIALNPPLTLKELCAEFWACSEINSAYTITADDCRTLYAAMTTPPGPVAQPIAQPTELTADLINMLNAIRPNFGDVGTRDVDVAAQRRRIDSAIVSLGLIMAHDGREHPTPRPVAQPIAPPVTPKDIEEIKDLLLWPVTEDEARVARDMLQSLHFDLSMAEHCAPTDEQIREGLPPLPTPICEKPASGPHFTAGQMQDYALTARAAAPVSGPTELQALLNRAADFAELNPSNYHHEDVRTLNDWGIDICTLAAAISAAPVSGHSASIERFTIPHITSRGNVFYLASDIDSRAQVLADAAQALVDAHPIRGHHIDALRTALASTTPQKADNE